MNDPNYGVSFPHFSTSCYFEALSAACVPNKCWFRQSKHQFNSTFRSLFIPLSINYSQKIIGIPLLAGDFGIVCRRHDQYVWDALNISRALIRLFSRKCLSICSILRSMRIMNNKSKLCFAWMVLCQIIRVPIQFV